MSVQLLLCTVVILSVIVAANGSSMRCIRTLSTNCLPASVFMLDGVAAAAGIRNVDCNMHANRSCSDDPKHRAGRQRKSDGGDHVAIRSGDATNQPAKQA